MSIDYGIYVGPYVRCVTEQVEATKERRACTNVKCEKQLGGVGDYVFCPRCGSPVGLVPYVEKADAVDQWEVRESFNDELADPSGDGYLKWARENGAHLWVPNTITPWRDCHLEAHSDFNLVEITARQVSQELTAFATQFATEIGILHERYSRVTVHWGIIQDYS